MTKPMTPEMLREIQEYPDSTGMEHLVREVERCWEQVATLRELLTKWGGHGTWCAAHDEHECDCGFEAECEEWIAEGGDG